VLGDGELPFPLTIKAEQFSTSAREKIEAAGVVCCSWLPVPDLPLQTRILMLRAPRS
jgi:ribosomal protein L18E